MDLALDGKKALITASTRGIGYATAARLAAEGATVVLNGRTRAGVDDAVARLRSAVPTAAVNGVAADVADPDQAARLVEAVGDVEILVNNAGVFALDDFVATDDEQWQRYWSTNVMSGVRLSRALLPAMLQRGDGRIVFIASESGVNVPADMIPYGVSKAAMIALSNGLAKLTRGSRVTVNAILGGPTLSDGVADAIAQVASAQGAPVESVRDAIVGSHPTSLLGRFIDPEEIAAVAAFVASPIAAATNGAALRVDGGALTGVL